MYMSWLPVRAWDDLLYRLERWERVVVIWRKMSAVTALENGN